ncbi:MAG: DNA methylase [Brevundimonas sp.]|nr:MAG: DNA methylase [Brevundimonas sp.]
MTAEDRALDVLWREAFGEPLPILGAGQFVTQVLKAKRAADRARGPD